MNLKDAFPIIDALQASNWDEAQFRALNHAGIDAVHVTLAFWHDCKETLSLLGKWLRWFDEYNDLILLVKSADDIRLAHSSGRTGIILGFQNSSPIEDELQLVSVFHSLGIRIMQLTYNNQNLIGSGCYEKNDAGLTNFGRNVIREMNRLGMIIDVSHTSERTCMEAIEFSERPIAITHANPLEFQNVVRNKSNELLKELAESGGVLGFSLYPMHLSGGARCTLDSFCEMVADTSEKIGIEHLGLGSDMCLGWDDSYLLYMRHGTWDRVDNNLENGSRKVRWPGYPEWFQNPSDLRNVAIGLANKGFSETEIAMLMGGNWFRFFKQGFKSKND